MNQPSVAYLVNSTPKYYGILPLHFALIRRYAPDLHWPIYLATEIPDHPICQKVAVEYGVKILPIPAERAGFLESRLAALEALKLEKGIQLVLPMQEDFLLERIPMKEALTKAVLLLLSKPDNSSVRLMPSPGPQGAIEVDHTWTVLNPQRDLYGFTFQATLWRLDDCITWYSKLCSELERQYPKATTDSTTRRHAEIRVNFAENPAGQAMFWSMEKRHLAWKRAGPWANAVYLSPWPYRPTAIVQGKLEGWAEELGKREGVPIQF